MNPLFPQLVTGVTGELLVQLRLFQYGVQAAPPLTDSGNDLIAIKGHIFKAIQVKTTEVDGKFKVPSLRNIGLTAPYMHDGRFKTLREVVDFYSDSVRLTPNIDRKMHYAKTNRISF